MNVTLIKDAIRYMSSIGNRRAISFTESDHIEMTITDVAIRAATSDVAVGVVTLKMGDFTTPDGELRAETQDKLSLILVKREDGWRITHGHNTVVDPKAQPIVNS